MPEIDETAVNGREPAYDLWVWTTNTDSSHKALEKVTYDEAEERQNKLFFRPGRQYISDNVKVCIGEVLYNTINVVKSEIKRSRVRRNYTYPDGKHERKSWRWVEAFVGDEDDPYA